MILRSPPRTKSLYVRANGYRVHTRVPVRPAPHPRATIVLVHGLGVSSRYMIPLLQALASDFRVYAPDLPGFGRSEKPSRTLTIAQLTDTLEAWMEVMGLDRAVLLGNSFGCQIIVSMALRYPHRLTHAVLQGPSIDPAAPTLVQQMLRLARDAFREPFGLLPIAAYDYLVAGLRRFIRTAAYSVDDPIEAKLPHVQVPALVVRGERDPIVSPEWARRMVELLPRAELVVIPDTAHAVNYAAPQALADAVRAFLEGRLGNAE